MAIGILIIYYLCSSEVIFGNSPKPFLTNCIPTKIYQTIIYKNCKIKKIILLLITLINKLI